MKKLTWSVVVLATVGWMGTLTIAAAQEVTAAS